MVNKWLTEAVINNAAWCDAIATSHNITTSWNESVWLCEYPMPRFYPNIITLRRDYLIDDQIDSIDLQLPSGWAIKDSFSELDLEDRGFTVAFNANWYCREPEQKLTDRKSLDFRIGTASSPSELNQWATAWGDGGGIFKPSLLKNNQVELLYCGRDNKIVSGLVANLSGDSVGISNVFGASDEVLACVDYVIEKYPTKGIVGYGSKTEIESLSEVGFQAIADLRVWLRD